MSQWEQEGTPGGGEESAPEGDDGGQEGGGGQDGGGGQEGGDSGDAPA